MRSRRSGVLPTTMPVDAITDSRSLRGFVAGRLGAVPGEEQGTLHVAAVWRPRDEDRHVVLRIRDESPKSAIDFLLLNLARARADAIVTTGRILREEPGVTHDLQGPPGVVRALSEWRRDVLRLEQPPWLVVLTGGRALDPAHPAFDAWARPVVLCPPSSVEAVSRRVRGTPIEAAALDGTGLRAALAWLCGERGARRVSIEAGPSTAIEAYAEPALVEELLLSVYAEPALAPELRAGELVSRAELERALGPARASFSVEEPSGRWVFERYRRAIVRAPTSPSSR